MKIRTLMLVLTIFLGHVLIIGLESGQAIASQPEVEWSENYGGSGWDEAHSLIQTSDGGYALAGYTYSYGEADFWLVKTDSSGKVQWSKTYGGTDDDRAHSLIQTSDGGYALAGYTDSYGKDDFWLVKTDSSGKAQWSKTYGGSAYEEAHSLIQTSDGGYALAGWTWPYRAGEADFWLVKTDSSGNMQWSENYGGSGWDAAYSLIQTSDGGYALAGDTWSYGAGRGDLDFWLVKLSPVKEPTNWPLICGIIIAVLAIITVAVLYRRAR